MTTILVVDDEPQIAEIATDYLRLAGFDVIVAGDGVRALEAVRGRHPDLVACGGCRCSLAAPEDRANTGDQLARAERFGDVVIGADLESVQPIVFLDACGEHDDRQIGLAADGARHGQSVEFR